VTGTGQGSCRDVFRALTGRMMKRELYVTVKDLPEMDE
jgi:hypothetical protein